jgi:hypothetical protein
MSEIKDGGPAFPQPLGTETVSGCEGLSLRDYFASKALIGLMAEPFIQGHLATAFEITKDENAVDTYAISAYKLADAMLAARGAA